MPSIQNIQDFLESQQQNIFVISSPPATGKTSILQQVYKSLNSTKVHTCFYVHMERPDNPFHKLNWFFDKNRNVYERYADLESIVLLIDDAHNSFPAPTNPFEQQFNEIDPKATFWDFLLKGSIRANLKVIIATTYLYAGIDSPAELKSVPMEYKLVRKELLISPVLAQDLFDDVIRTNYNALMQMIIDDCNGHIDALVIAIANVHSEIEN